MFIMFSKTREKKVIVHSLALTLALTLTLNHFAMPSYNGILEASEIWMPLHSEHAVWSPSHGVQGSTVYVSNLKLIQRMGVTKMVTSLFCFHMQSHAAESAPLPDGGNLTI